METRETVSMEDEEAVLDAVDRWHEGAGFGVPLHEYLGWTWEQYSAYVGRGALRPRIPRGIMTIKEIIFAPADGELDHEVATRIMGWAIHFRNTGCYCRAEEKERVMSCNCSFVGEWKPSTNISQAFLVVEKMREKGFRLFLQEYSDGIYAKFCPSGVKSETVEAVICQVPPGGDAGAICKAALVAILSSP